jgi:hypothetical protein
MSHVRAPIAHFPFTTYNLTTYNNAIAPPLFAAADVDWLAAAACDM